MKSMPSYLRVLILLVLALVSMRAFARPAENADWFDQFEGRRRPLVVAHADDSGTSPWPGDTLFFLKNAYDLGVDVLEMNVHMTADERIVLMHDETVDDTTDGTGLISGMTLTQVQALDAAYNWTQDDGKTFPYRGQGIYAPTLDAVFETFPGFPMVVEIKQTSPSMSDQLCELIHAYFMEDHVIVASFNDDVMSEFRTACPDVATASASDETRQFVILNLGFLSNPIAPKYQAFQVPLESSGIKVVTPSFVNAAHRRNIEVHPWTINDPDDMQRLIDMGVDAIMTDRPDLLLDLLEKMP